MPSVYTPNNAIVTGSESSEFTIQMQVQMSLEVNAQYMCTSQLLPMQ